jgi:hypothetical protein
MASCPNPVARTFETQCLQMGTLCSTLCPTARTRSDHELAHRTLPPEPGKAAVLRSRCPRGCLVAFGLAVEG